jgi:hypothetical protein
VPLGDEAPLAGIPNLALRRERAPNLIGGQLLGYSSDWDAALRRAATAAVVIVLDADLTPADESALAGAPGVLVLLGTVLAEGLRDAELVLPITTMAEENGSYVNRDRRVQRFAQAKSQPGMARPAWWVAGEVLAGPGPSADAPSTASEAFQMLGEWWPIFASVTHDNMGFTGRALGSAAPATAAQGAPR